MARKTALRLLSCLFISCAISPGAEGQSTHKLFTSNLLVEGKAYYGFFYAHHLELELYNAHFPAFEINIQQQTYGKHAWERAFGYPVIGASLFYCGLGYSPSLGQSFALMPYINFPLYRSGPFFFGFRFALGVGYLTNRFDRLNNYKDLAIGSHLNAAVNLMLEARYTISYRLTASAGVCLQHFSNGSLKMPNFGVNAPLVNVGLAFRPKKENRQIPDRFYAPTEPYSVMIQRAIDFNFGVSAGYKNMQQVYGENYFIGHIYENTLYQVSRKSKWGLGFDLSYDPSQLKTLEKAGNPATSNLQILRPGMNIAYALLLGRTEFLLNLGYYLGGKEKSNGPLYEKISVQYNFGKNFFANIMLKVHFGRADYIGWGLGYRFDVLFGRKTVK